MSNNEYDELVLKYQYLVYKIAGRFKSKYVEYDDLVQAGFMGLLKAIKNNINDDTFIAYAAKYITCEIKDEIKKSSLYKVSDYYYKLSSKINNIKSDDMEEIARIANTSLDNVIFIKSNAYYSIEKVDNYDNYQSNNFKIPLGLSKLEEDVLLMRVVYRYTQKEISESLRVSQSKISRILKNIVEKIV